MFSNSFLLLTVSLTILMAQFSPLTALIISIALFASEVCYVYINQEDIANV